MKRYSPYCPVSSHHCGAMAESKYGDYFPVFDVIALIEEMRDTNKDSISIFFLLNEILERLKEI